MAREYTTSIPSGTVPHIQEHPSLAVGMPAGRYPVPSQRDELRTRTGTGSVVLNPQDFSIFISLRSQAITVTNTATPLPTNPLEGRRALVIHNNGGSILYIGASNVTVGNGFPIAANEKISIDIQGNTNVTVYGITGSSADVRILELA